MAWDSLTWQTYAAAWDQMMILLHENQDLTASAGNLVQAVCAQFPSGLNFGLVVASLALIGQTERSLAKALHPRKASNLCHVLWLTSRVSQDPRTDRTVRQSQADQLYHYLEGPKHRHRTCRYGIVFTSSFPKHAADVTSDTGGLYFPSTYLKPHN